MESSPERPCPSCSAPAQENQRWCLECGAELPQASRRSTLKPVVGIATTLTVLVGAASAAGFTLLQDGKQPPPPATTVAQQPPPVTTPPVTTPPPVDTTLPDTSGDLDVPDTTAGRSAGGGGTGSGGGGGTSTPPPVDNSVPDYSDDIDTSTPNPPPPDDSGEDVDSDDGSVTDDSGAERAAERRAAQPRLKETNIALGAVAVPYAPYAEDDLDLGDAGAVVDGSTSTSWRTPLFEDPAAHPQLGVYVDLAGAERLTKLVLTTPTPGMSFEDYTARSGPPKSITAAGWS
ncbi:MAG TPA: zinc ribbon domain-containing protein, partial [Conexibacter sp.]|nr:zinc ribbon domain-containing protein [Conexibacter sp.]